MSQNSEELTQALQTIKQQGKRIEYLMKLCEDSKIDIKWPPGSQQEQTTHLEVNCSPAPSPPCSPQKTCSVRLII